MSNRYERLKACEIVNSIKNNEKGGKGTIHVINEGEKIPPLLRKVSLYGSVNILIDFFIFILLSQESGGGAMLRTNPNSPRICICFRVFQVNFASDFFNLLLAGFHLAEIIIVKHLTQGRNNETRLGDEPLTLRS